MPRQKKSRRLKGKLDIKTGSKKNFIATEDKGKIPSKNKLKKHKNKPKSAYQKHLDATNQKDESTGINRPHTKASPEEAVEAKQSEELKQNSKEPKNFEDLSGDELLDLLG